MKFDEKVDSLLSEYVSSEMVTLKKYMSMTDEQKYDELIHLYFNYLPFYLEKVGKNLNGVMSKLTSYDASDLNDWDYKDNIISEFNSTPKGKKLMTAFGKWLLEECIRSIRGYSAMQDYSDDFSTAELPSWIYLSKISLIKNQWLVHFTGVDPKKIVDNGFSIGTSDPTKLGLTTYIDNDDESKEGGGYNFAFTLEDFDKYGRDKSRYFSKRYQYGSGVVLFRASGYRFWHTTDNQYQVIFYGDTAKDIIPIESADHSHNDVNWLVRNITNDEVLFQALELSEVINWIKTNYEQYRKVLHK